MNVSVVVPCRDESASIRQLLDALAAQTRLPTEAVIVDDGSVDGTSRVIEQWRSTDSALHVRVVSGPARGVAAAVNTGITACQADVIVRLDGHSIPAPDYVELSLAALNRSGVGVAGGLWKIAPGAETIVARAIARVASHPLGSGGAQYRSATDASRAAVTVDTVPFGAFRRDLWEQLGGFDESLRANEDYDFNYRVRRTGLSVVLDPRIQSAYFARPTIPALAQQYYRYGFWKYQMLRKDPQALHWRQIPPALLLPWVIATVIVAGYWPSSLSMAAALSYPVLTAAAAGQIALRLKSFAAWPAAAAAFVTLHLAWSAGFLRAAFGLSAPAAVNR